LRIFILSSGDSFCLQRSCKIILAGGTYNVHGNIFASIKNLYVFNLLLRFLHGGTLRCLADMTGRRFVLIQLSQCRDKATGWKTEETYFDFSFFFFKCFVADSAFYLICTSGSFPWPKAGRM
jgi:hypothetical protein